MRLYRPVPAARTPTVALISCSTSALKANCPLTTSLDQELGVGRHRESQGPTDVCLGPARRWARRVCGRRPAGCRKIAAAAGRRRRSRRHGPRRGARRGPAEASSGGMASRPAGAWEAAGLSIRGAWRLKGGRRRRRGGHRCYGGNRARRRKSAARRARRLRRAGGRRSLRRRAHRPTPSNSCSSRICCRN